MIGTWFIHSIWISCAFNNNLGYAIPVPKAHTNTKFVLRINFGNWTLIFWYHAGVICILKSCLFEVLCKKKLDFRFVSKKSFISNTLVVSRNNESTIIGIAVSYTLHVFFFGLKIERVWMWTVTSLANLIFHVNFFWSRTVKCNKVLSTYLGHENKNSAIPSIVGTIRKSHAL